MTTDWLKETNGSWTETIVLLCCNFAWKHFKSISNAFFQHEVLMSYCVLVEVDKYKHQECLKPLFIWFLKRAAGPEGRDWLPRISRFVAMQKYDHMEDTRDKSLLWWKNSLERTTITNYLSVSRRSLLCCSGQKFKKSEQSKKQKVWSQRVFIWTLKQHLN